MPDLLTVEDLQVEYLRAYPSTLFAEEPLREAQLFEAAEDDWGFENVVSQVCWARSLAHEGGLFAVVGRARPA